MALKERPKMIVTGGTAYPRLWDFKSFSEIAKEVGALLLADISHVAGLIVGGMHPDPAPYADVIMTTTHKTLRGPRGAMIMCRKEFAEAIDKAVFPGLQGGPHNHTTAAIAVALKEAATPEFKTYAKKVVSNAKTLADELNARGFGQSRGLERAVNCLIFQSFRSYDAQRAVIKDALTFLGGTVCRSNPDIAQCT
jgi:glycine hydroxymethyltransferase